jgi:peptide/nickel transport system permease protein
MFRQRLNTRKRVIVSIAIAAVYLISILIWGVTMKPDAYAIHYADKFIPPSASHPFGTDFMGHDMYFRCFKGLANRLVLGLAASIISSVIGLVFGISSAIIGGTYDKFIQLCVDCCMGLPHLVLLILISFMVRRGAKGVMIGVALTHWPELTRLIRAEVLQVRSTQFVKAAQKMGKTRFQIAKEHV